MTRLTRRPIAVRSPLPLAASAVALLLPLLAAGGCSTASGGARAAAGGAPSPTSARSAPAAAPATSEDAVPAFATAPLATWGAMPPGTPHGERARTFDLQHQIVRVSFDWRRHAVVGETTLRVAALDSALHDVALDAVGMRITAVSDFRSGAALRYDYDGRTLVVHLAAPVAPHATAAVLVRYESVRPKKGAYFVDRRHVVWTQGETEDTRYWVPTYDFPNDKTTWEFLIRTPKNEKALANGYLDERRVVGDSIDWHWVQSRPASTYLMSVVTGDFVVLQDTWREVPIGYWTYPDSVQAAWRGFGKTPRMVDLFSKRTGVDYPWAKYDQAVAPDYIFGGMENVSATTQADDAILHPAWAEPQANADDLVSHELGHQWYGDLLTTRDWSHVWLNEGFATFLEQIFHEADKGADEGAYYRLGAHEEVIAADARARRPLVYDRWVTDPLELFFSGHIYPKGATVLQSLRHQLGDSLFWRAMNRYTVDHAYNTVVSADLERAFEQTTGRSYEAFFRQWVYGAGYPAFRVRYAYDASSRRLTLTAEQVQPRDSLTGLFDADVDVKVLTDAGATRAVVPVRGASTGNATTRFEMTLPAAPRAIRWDEGGWLLDVTDFPRSTRMLAYQLAKDDDVIGRIEAVTLMRDRASRAGSGDSLALAAIAGAAHGDRFWAVRQRAVAALGVIADSTPDDSVAANRQRRSMASAVLLAASRDPDSRVREAAATALGAFAGASDVAVRLRELAGDDSSRYVRAAAVGSYAAVAPDSALALAREMVRRDSWTDIERVAALTALGRVDRPGVVELLRGFLVPSASSPARTAAIASLAERADKGREGEIAAMIAPLLDADDLFVRMAAADALGRLGQPSSVPALQARRRVEAESRVVNTIDAALRAIGAAGK